MARPVRVLLIAPSWDILGGQAVQAQHIMDGMSKEPTIRMGFLPINPRAPGPFRVLQKIKYVRTATTGFLYWFLLVARTWRYDVVHIFSAAYWGYILWSIPAILWGRLMGKKVILHYHDGQCEDHLRNWRTAIPTLKMAHAIIAPSGFVVDVMRPFGLKAEYILNTLDLSNFHYRRRSRLLPILMTNRILEPLYNVDCILKAYKIVSTRYPEASLTIAHDGPSRPHLEALTKELELPNVKFLGKVPHSQVAKLYDDADVYLTSPNIDCMPGSLLESFASGIPVVATRAGGIPYILDDGRTGILVPINDHEGLAAATLRLLEDPSLVERLTGEALKECDRYKWKAVHGQWVALYHRLAD